MSVVRVMVWNSVWFPPTALLYLPVGLELRMTLVLVRMRSTLLRTIVAWTVTVALVLLPYVRQLIVFEQTPWCMGLSLWTILSVWTPGVLDMALVGKAVCSMLVKERFGCRVFLIRSMTRTMREQCLTVKDLAIVIAFGIVMWLILPWLRLTSTRRLVCLPGLVSSLILSVWLLLGAVLCGCALVTGCIATWLLVSCIRTLGEVLMIRAVLRLTKHTHGEGPSVCRVWQMLIGCVWNGIDSCRESMIRKTLLVWTHVRSWCIVDLKFLWAKFEMKRDLLSVRGLRALGQSDFVRCR